MKETRGLGGKLHHSIFSFCHPSEWIEKACIENSGTRCHYPRCVTQWIDMHMTYRLIASSQASRSSSEFAHRTYLLLLLALPLREGGTTNTWKQWGFFAATGMSTYHAWKRWATWDWARTRFHTWKPETETSLDVIAPYTCALLRLTSLMRRPPCNRHIESDFMRIIRQECRGRIRFSAMHVWRKDDEVDEMHTHTHTHRHTHHAIKVDKTSIMRKDKVTALPRPDWSPFLPQKAIANIDRRRLWGVQENERKDGEKTRWS